LVGSAFTVSPYYFEIALLASVVDFVSGAIIPIGMEVSYVLFLGGVSFAVIVIGDYAFYRINITSIIISNSLTTINRYAFSS
jgi:hypothetical protein